MPGFLIDGHVYTGKPYICNVVRPRAMWNQYFRGCSFLNSSTEKNCTSVGGSEERTVPSECKSSTVLLLTKDFPHVTLFY